MREEDKVRFCRVVGMLLLADGELHDIEYQFFGELMSRFALSDESAREVRRTINVDHDFTADIEALRQVGAAKKLMEALELAAKIDGHVDRRELAMIARVRRILQYRLGQQSYILPLTELESRPLKALFEDFEHIGSGAHGHVFKARERASGEVRAIKKLHAPGIGRAHEDRFWREVKILSQLRSPHTVQVIGAGFDVNEPYMIQEYLDGETLHGVLHRRGPMSAEQVRALGLQLLEGLAEAHDLGIVHRDLKPDNIMLVGEDRDRVKILDFGIAGVVDTFKSSDHFQITDQQVTMGTLSYMPPEQLAEMFTARRETDIYAVGLILCECLTGSPVFTGGEVAIIQAQMSDAPAPLPEAVTRGPLGEVLKRACAKSWQRRFGPPDELMKKIRAIEARGTDEEINAFYRGLYKVYSPADEMRQAVEAIDLSRKPRRLPWRKRQR